MPYTCLKIVAFGILLVFLPTHGKAALNSERASALVIANNYIQNVRKWEPNSYILKRVGKLEGNRFILTAFKNEDVEALKKEIRELDGGRSGFFTSEFVLIIYLDKGEVVEDIRPGDKDRHPRP